MLWNLGFSSEPFSKTVSQGIPGLSLTAGTPMNDAWASPCAWGFEKGSLQNMGGNHRGADIFVTQQLLDPPNILPVLQEVGRIGVTRRASFTSATAEDGPPWLSAACAPKLQRRARLRVKKRKCVMEPGVFRRALFKSRKPGNTVAVPHRWDPHD